MPVHCFPRYRICGWLLLWIAGCIGCAAQAPSGGTFKPDDAGFDSLLQKGFNLHRQARFAEALPIFEQALKLEPDDYFANLLSGIDLLRMERPREATVRLQIAARAKPDEETPEEYLGEALAALHRYSEASEAYHRALQRGHNSEDALEAWAGFALERFRQIGESLRSSREGVATVARLQDLATKPNQAMACGRPISALEREFATKQTGPEHFQVAYALSICYAMEAGAAAGQLQSKAKDDAAVHRLRGDVLLRIKTDAQAAAEEYRKAIGSRPGDPALLARLAEAQLSAGDAEGAKQSAQAAFAIDPHRREALHTLAFLAMSNRDYEQALPYLRQLVTESPGDISAQVELGRALAQTGAGPEALHYLGPALDRGYPDEKGALHALEARVLRELGREGEAAKAAAEARRLSDAFQARSKDTPEAQQNAPQ